MQNARPAKGPGTSINQHNEERSTLPMGAEMTTENEKCYAYQDRDGSLDLDSIADSVERVRDKMLVDFYGQRDVQWDLLLQRGKVVEVVILIVPEVNAE